MRIDLLDATLSEPRRDPAREELRRRCTGRHADGIDADEPALVDLALDQLGRNPFAHLAGTSAGSGRARARGKNCEVGAPVTADGEQHVEIAFDASVIAGPVFGNDP